MTEVNKKWMPFEDENNPVDDKSLKALSQKCNKLEALQTEIEQQDQYIKSLKEQHRKLSEEEIPTFLQEKGLTSISLNNGTQVSISEDIKPGVLVANRAFCYGWLRAFVGEQHRKGTNLPDEFGVHVANKTKIVQKKKIT